ncbi:nucleoid-associated protein [Siccirubricoccus sp. KC 17139]|uniref:Nucleoid-associated protein n=1 Tax=Siccirubricoccus soli TaxID=2899147 RepID=A0ABT1D1C2_9PROT|nr:nucleoid-associated protein [Siccirubricoccus soli]MCO6415684.1 nucleoid-associated protein [Siccirubricoccus soli]MCP2681816.1 nucleoid-associated protein [Siccirubricoccus soli]
MGFLTEEESSCLRINHVILHVVGGKAEFEPQPELCDHVHADFFLGRIRDSAIDSVHRFRDNSETKEKLERIAKGEISFEAGAQDLSRAFSRGHVGSSKDGAFFVFELGATCPNTHLFCMIKYDYRQAIELYDNGGQNALREIVQAFIKEPRAIQKICLVRVIDGVADANVSARDRMGNAPDLTEYFEKFLDVKRERDNSELTRNMSEAVRASLQDCREFLPDGSVATALSAVKETLRTRETVDDEAVREAVLVAAGRPTDENVRAALEKSVNRHLKNKRIFGVVFRPDAQVLGRAPRRFIRTAENVEVTYPGDQEGHAVKRVENSDGSVTISIRTAQKLIEDGVLAERNGRRG